MNSTFLLLEADQIMLPTSTQSDKRGGDPTNEAFFSVHSAYHGIKSWEEVDSSQVSSTFMETRIWNKLWHYRVVSKHVSLSWKILHNDIAMKKNLTKRGILIEPICPRCNLE